MRKIIVYDSGMEIYEIVKTALQHISVDIEYTTHFSRIIHQIESKNCAAVIFNLDKTPEGETENIELLHIIKRIAPDLAVIGAKTERTRGDFYASILKNVTIVQKTSDIVEFRINILRPLIRSILPSHTKPDIQSPSTPQ